MNLFVSLFFRSCCLFLLIFTTHAVADSKPESGKIRLAGHLPHDGIQESTYIGPLDGKTHISLTYVLPLNNQDKLDDLLKRLYDPTDALHGQYLSPDKFTHQFGATTDDYQTIITHAKSLGLSIDKAHSNRMILEVSGTAATIENAFNISLHQYQTADCRQFFAADADPEVSTEVASKILGIVGLDDYHILTHQARSLATATAPAPKPGHIPGQGSGPLNALTPSDITKAYGLDLVTEDGKGQVVAVFALSTYDPNDIAVFKSYYGLPDIPIVHVVVNGGSGVTPDGAHLEATLDVELQMALAPGAQAIYFYEGKNSSGVLATYNQIAQDNIAKQISTSWGGGEPKSGNFTLQLAENQIFQQMAAQGQSIYAASGDCGACNQCGVTCTQNLIQALDPASQPFVCGVGGTRLLLNSDKSYHSEVCWNNNGTYGAGASGGAVSIIWPIPSWQIPVTTCASQSFRNVPDVSLNSGTGYSIYYNSAWQLIEGTSCSAPLWAAFTARVNQARAANGRPPLGCPNPALYSIGTGINYHAAFHDITTVDNNFYQATQGYDNATGWGSFKGPEMLLELSNY